MLSFATLQKRVFKMIQPNQVFMDEYNNSNDELAKAYALMYSLIGENLYETEEYGALHDRIFGKQYWCYDCDKIIAYPWNHACECCGGKNYTEINWQE